MIPVRPVRATYDAARDSDEYRNYWANADYLDADAGHSKAIRSKLVARSRYEIANNGYSDGIAQTWSTDLVGVGPRLRMLTGSTGFNQLVELQFDLWMKATSYRRKLWAMAHAKHTDGEAFGVIRTNRKVRHAVAIDVTLYETEQCSTPMLPFTQEGYVDGIKFDEFGNPEHYDILRRHPGSTGWGDFSLEPEQVPARYVLHWFKMRRPGQHRGIPDCASTLNVGAASRRFREATLAAAETAADFTALLKTGFQPDEMDAVSPMSTLEIQKRMMTALPNGWDMSQLKAEHPSTTYEAFTKALISEQARPKNMPLNKAAADSSNYNFASGRLDHSTYYAAIDVDREDVNDCILDPLFDVWFAEAVRVFRWLGGNPDTLTPLAKAHLWDWPKHYVADIATEASANDTRLRNGSLSLSALHSEAGADFEDELQKMATDFGITPDDMRAVLLRELYPSGVQALTPPAPPAPPITEPASDDASDEEQGEEQAAESETETSDEEETADATA